MEAYQLDTKLSLVYRSVLSLSCTPCVSVCVCICVYRSVHVGIYSFNEAVSVSYTCVRGRHVVALVLFSSYFFHFRFFHSHAFTLALTPSRNTHTLYYSLQNINYFHLFIWWIKRIKDGWQVNLSWGRILSDFFLRNIFYSLSLLH